MTHPLDELLPEICQLLDAAKAEWEPKGEWTEWDQSVRDRIAAYNLNRERLAAAVGDPRHSMRPLTDDQVDRLYVEKIAPAHFSGKQGVMRGIVRAVEEAHGIGTETTDGVPAPDAKTKR